MLPLTNLFELKNEIYKPQIQYTPQKLNEILQSLLHERAMKMDASYVGAVSRDGAANLAVVLQGFFLLQIVWHENTKPTHTDVLAFDIQRGRDHGLQPYYKYLEVCNNNKQVTGWTDFEPFISKEVSKMRKIPEFFPNFRVFQLLGKLQNVYDSWQDVDLIIGGISEKTFNGTVGPTFSCILGTMKENNL